MKKKSCLLVVLLLLMIAGVAKSAVSMSALFSDNMVLQQKSVVTMWGHAMPSKPMSVKTSWNHLTVNCVTDTRSI